MFFFINLLGLTVAFSCVLFVYAYNYHQWHYDGFHSKADRIFRITMDVNQGESSMHDARLHSGYVDYMSTQFPQFEKTTKITSFGKAIVNLNSGEKFYSSKVYGADSCFFEVFDYPIVLGQRETMFKNPEQVAVTRTVALKYFRTLDVIGKQVSIQHGKEKTSKNYTITGVLEDFPDNTHFKAEWLCTLSSLDSRNLWLYTYTVLTPNTSVKSLEHSLDTLFAQENHNPIFDLQPITDIHLKSHKTRELEAGGNGSALYLLLFGALVIYLMALANFFNLNYVQLIKNKSAHSIKKLHGANRSDLVGEEVTEKIVLILLSVAMAVLLFISAKTQFKLPFINPLLWVNYATLLLILALAAIFFAVLPVFRFYSRLNLSALKPTKTLSFRFFFVTQFVLSIMVIATVLVMKKQIGMINLLHPGANASNMVVMPHVPESNALKYDLLKEKLLKHPEILDMTAVMEEPAGAITDNFHFKMEGVENKENRTLNILCIDSNFFSFFGIPSIAGTVDLGATASPEWENNVLDLNTATEQHNTAEIDRLTPMVSNYREKYLLNQAALDYLGITDPNQAIGKRFEIDFQIPYLFPAGQVVGVVPDFHYTSLFGKEKPLMIVSRKIFSRNYICRIDTNNLAKSLAVMNDEWKSINPDAPFEYEFLSDSYQRVYANEYTQSKVLSLFALIAVLISVLGMYALITFQMEKQTKEIGVRKVIGAKVLEIMLMHNREVVKWVAMAFLLATPIAYYAMNQWLQSFAYKTPLSWWVFALSGIIALGIAIVTVSWQSWKAATRNPVESLRYE
jgi:putative ABC transport system permease protein